MDGIQRIAAERQRQVDDKGYTAAHDDRLWVRELAAAAACYRAAEDAACPMPPTWPLDPARWKPRDRAHNLVRAGALYLAAAEAFDRRKPALANQPGSYGAHLRAQVQACAAAIDALT